MPKMKEEFFAVLAPKRANYGPAREETGTRDWESFRVDRITRSRPVTKVNEVAVRLNLIVDSSIFDKLIPKVEIELGERELFVNTKVEVNGVAVEDEPEDDDL